jgi:transcriptional regulator with XRE-family HTH domain
MTGLSESEISQIESGVKRSPRVDTIQRIAMALDVSMDFLLGCFDYGAPLEKALAMESLALFLKASKPRVTEEQSRALRKIAESGSGPQSIREWELFLKNVAIYESSMKGHRQ